ncbi:hypothetical protein BN1221_03887 [Brenneria goodwinii]|uniref:Uncharacterized protein n=1 Tax=Brenneria goodwinii TaxID=1109412 RepID=A0A0G4JZT7_9GAMM|nr:hypothetical protein BN1221_03887 [Brenneria goodwinii]
MAFNIIIEIQPAPDEKNSREAIHLLLHGARKLMPAIV